MSKVGYGLLGVGKLTCKTLIPAFKFCQNSRLVALGTRDVNTARAKLKDLPPEVMLGSYEEVLNHPEVDVVYVVLPNHLHAQWSIKALQLGKAVLCEKPLCLSLNELNAMQNAAKMANKPLAEAFMYRFHPQHKKVKEILDSGVLGELRLFRAQFSYFLDDPSNIRLKPECGGGALMDVGCYLLDSLLWLSERKIEKYSMFQKMNECGIDSSTSIQLQLEKGLQAQLFCSTNSPREHTMVWIGEKGWLEIPEAYVPASNKQVHLNLKTEKGHEVIKIDGCHTYALQMEHFSKNILLGCQSKEGDPLFINTTLYKTMDQLVLGHD